MAAIEPNFSWAFRSALAIPNPNWRCHPFTPSKLWEENIFYLLPSCPRVTWEVSVDTAVPKRNLWGSEWSGMSNKGHRENSLRWGHQSKGELKRSNWFASCTGVWSCLLSTLLQFDGLSRRPLGLSGDRPAIGKEEAITDGGEVCLFAALLEKPLPYSWCDLSLIEVHFSQLFFRLQSPVPFGETLRGKCNFRSLVWEPNWVMFDVNL